MPSYPATRHRRLRQAPWIRALSRETLLAPSQLIQPVFVVEGNNTRTPVASMPGIDRISLDLLPPLVEEISSLGIPALALFPSIDPALRDPEGSQATNPENLVCRAIRTVHDTNPQLGIMCDVALDPFTSHGHDGLMNDAGTILNDETLTALVAQALVQTEAGCHMLAPSDMMDGRIQAIRTALENHGFQDTLILSYAAKYASAFYGPFRDAVGSSAQLVGDKRTYQMDPANTNEALKEIALDIEEGADMVMVKPGMPYLDIISRAATTFHVPILAYQVSGEYTMLETSAHNGYLDGNATMMESLLAFRRAGAHAIITYYATRAARLLTNTTP